MKANKYTIGLLVLVVLIWGAVAYKLLNPKEDEWVGTVYQNPNITFTNDTLRLDTLPLKLAYKDPFLKYNKYVSKSNQSASVNISPAERRASSRRSTPKQNRSRLRWPKLEYNGLMTDKDKTIGFLRINDKSEIVAESVVVQELEVIGIYVDSVRLKYKHEFKTIIKSKKNE